MQGFLSTVGKLYKYLCGFIMVVMVLIVFVNTVLRYFFSSGITMSEELLRYLFVWISFLSIVVVFKEHGHLGVTILTDRLHGRVKIALAFITNIFILYVMAFFVEGGLINMQESATTIGQTTGIPFTWVIFSSIFAAVCISVLVLLEMYYQVREFLGSSTLSKSNS